MITPWFSLMRSLCCSETCWTRLASEEVENSQRAHLKFRACLVLKKKKNQNIEIYLDFRVKRFQTCILPKMFFQRSFGIKMILAFQTSKVLLIILAMFLFQMLNQIIVIWSLILALKTDQFIYVIKMANFDMKFQGTDLVGWKSEIRLAKIGKTVYHPILA